MNDQSELERLEWGRLKVLNWLKEAPKESTESIVIQDLSTLTVSKEVAVIKQTPVASTPQTKKQRPPLPAKLNIPLYIKNERPIITERTSSISSRSIPKRIKSTDVPLELIRDRSSSIYSPIRQSNGLLTSTDTRISPTIERFGNASPINIREKSIYSSTTLAADPSLFHIAPRKSSFNHNNHKSQTASSINAFGHRPSSRLIVDKLNDFFPTIANNPDFNMIRTSSLLRNHESSTVNSPQNISQSSLSPPPRKQSLCRKSPTSPSPSDSAPLASTNIPIEIFSSGSSGSNEVVAPVRKSSYNHGRIKRIVRIDNTSEKEFGNLHTLLHTELDFPVSPDITSSSPKEDLILRFPPPDSPNNTSPATPTGNLPKPVEATSIEWIRSYLIGKGSFGKVYLGLNVSNCKFMAVKQVDINPKNLKDEKEVTLRNKIVQGLYAEIALLQELQHENIVQYLGFDVDATTISVFLEYVSGGSASTLLAKIGFFPEVLIQFMLRQILNGLKYLHEEGIIHRDIKCANILVDENGIAKIADFGISKKQDRLAAYKLDSTMSFQGSIYWMAPEVIKSQSYSAKVDIWSLGCVVIEMFTATHPWSHLDQMQALWKLGKNIVPNIDDKFSGTAKDFISKCFIIEAELRPTAAELLKHDFIKGFDHSFEFPSFYAEAMSKFKEQTWFDGESSYQSSMTGQSCI